MQNKEAEKLIIERTPCKIRTSAKKIRDYCFGGIQRYFAVFVFDDRSIECFEELGKKCLILSNYDMNKVFPAVKKTYYDSVSHGTFPALAAITDENFYRFEYDLLYPAEFFVPNVEIVNVNGYMGPLFHFYPKLRSIISGKINHEYDTLISSNGSVYFHFTDSDPVSFNAGDLINAGSSKRTATISVYTDNPIIKSDAEAKADQYTIVNVYHLDGSDWV